MSRFLPLFAVLVLIAGCNEEPAGSGRITPEPATVAMAPRPGFAPKPPPPAEAPLAAWSWNPPHPGAVNLHALLMVDITRDDPVAKARQSRDFPAGQAALMLRGEKLIGHPDDRVRSADGKLLDFASPWFAAGERVLREQVTTFFSRYHDAGGRLDYLTVDNEAGMGVYGLTRPHISAILADPRAKPLIAELGFDRVEAMTDYIAPAYTLGGHPDETEAVDKPYMAWDRVLSRMVVEALHRSIYLPVMALYPGCRANNYDSYRASAAHPVIDINGHLGRSAALFGNRACAQFYGLSGFAARRYADGHAYGAEPFAVLRYLLNNHRALVASNPEPLTPWISFPGWTGDTAFPSTLGNTGYWLELVYHLALAGADDFLLFNPQPRGNAKQPDGQRAQESDDLLMEAALAEVNRRIGGAHRRLITPDRFAWDCDLLATGCQLGDDRVLWRVTVPRFSDKVRVQPGGEVLETHARLGLWYVSKPGQTITFTVERTP